MQYILRPFYLSAFSFDFCAVYISGATMICFFSCFPNRKTSYFRKFENFSRRLYSAAQSPVFSMRSRLRIFYRFCMIKSLSGGGQKGKNKNRSPQRKSNQKKGRQGWNRTTCKKEQNCRKQKIGTLQKLKTPIERCGGVGVWG